MEKKWWHDKTAYQIYPKSFYDSNGDGIGDLQGIIRKLDYLKDLGVELIWISPVYASPFADQGYDISDYYKIDPVFGTMEDMDLLLAEAGKRGLSILMDLVVNHCSDEHEWFRLACKDPKGPYGDYFYIEKAPKGQHPSNLRGYFGGSVWEVLPGHEDLQYLHFFHKKQPDLNWENPTVRKEIYRNMNWWLDKGLGGFRVDAISNIKKKLPFHDYEPDREDGLASIDRMLEEADSIGTFLNEMKAQTFGPRDSFTVGEVFSENPEQLEEMIGKNGYFSTIFDFSQNFYGISDKGWYDYTPITPEDYKHCTFRSQERVRDIGFLANIIENHDEPRGVSHYLPEDARDETSKKLLGTLFYFLRGIPFLYQGQEIGMENLGVRPLEEIDDVNTIDQYEVARKAGLSEEEALKAVSVYSRDNGRAPIPWNDGPNGGFTTGKPWLGIPKNYKKINVEEQEKRKDSVLSFYKEMIRLRKDPDYKETLIYGELIPYKEEQEGLMAYFRKKDRTLLVLGNFKKEALKVELPGRVKKVLLSNLEKAEQEGQILVLAPHQALVLELDA